METVICSQQEKLTDLEDRNRRNNLIVFGIPENANETSDEINKEVLVGVFEERLGVKVSIVERKHRLGKKREDKTRPVIMKLFDYNEKTEIFNNCKKLKGNNISVANDFSDATLQKRILFWESAKAEKEGGSRVKLVYDKIIINDVTFVWDDERACRVRLNRKRANEAERE